MPRKPKKLAPQLLTAASMASLDTFVNSLSCLCRSNWPGYPPINFPNTTPDYLQSAYQTAQSAVQQGDKVYGFKRDCVCNPDNRKPTLIILSSSYTPGDYKSCGSCANCPHT